MKKIIIILKKELRSYFDSPIAYVFIVLFLVLTGAYFANTFFLHNVSSLRGMLEMIPLLLLFFAPAITMRSIAEEKKNGTFEIVGTKAIRTGEIIVGKFLAAWILVCATLLPTLAYAVTLTILGSADMGMLAGGYLGLLLLGGAFVAVGILGSSLTENQIVAFILSFVVLLVLFVVDRVLLYLPIGIVPYVEYFGINHHFASLARGIIDSRDIVYFVSLGALSLLAATTFADKEASKTFLKLREFSWTQQTLRFALAASTIIFLNLVSAGIFVRVDITDEKVYTLSEPSKKLIESLDDTFFIKAYLSPELPPPYHHHRRVIQELLDEYRAYAPAKVHYQFINPHSDPALEREALQNGITPIQVKVIRDDQFQTEQAYAGLAFFYADQAERISAITTPENLEFDIATSLRRMMAPQEKSVIGFLTGQGEYRLEEMTLLAGALAKNYELSSIDLSTAAMIPQDVSVLLVIGSKRRFGEREKLLLDQYLMRGGRIGFFIDAVDPTGQRHLAHPVDLNLDDMFDAYGWIVNRDLVADARCARITFTDQSRTVPVPTETSFPLVPVSSDFHPTHPVVRNLSPLAFTLVSSLDVRLASIRGISADVLVTSSARSRIIDGEEFNVHPGQQFSLESFTDRNIPFAAAFEGEFRSLFAKRTAILDEAGRRLPVDPARLTAKSPATRIVVVADADFVLDNAQHGYENIPFAAGIVDWLADRSGLLEVRKRDVTPKPLKQTSEETRTLVKYANFVGPPVLVVIAGLLRWVAKSKRRKNHRIHY